MKKGGGKAKGAAFERTIAKQLSLWWTKGSRDDVFWRSSISGGRATIRKKKGVCTENAAGDICSIGKTGHPFTETFYIEIKCGYPKISVLELVDTDNKNKLLEQWIEKAETEKILHGRKEILLIVKRTRCQPVVIYNPELTKPYKKGSIFFSLGEYNYQLMRLEDFLKIVEPKYIRLKGIADLMSTRKKRIRRRPKSKK